MKNIFKIFRKKVKEVPYKKEYRIRESIHGNFYYHISLDNKPLCGKDITLYTGIPISFWGKQTHLGETYCEECDKIYKKDREL